MEAANGILARILGLEHASVAHGDEIRRNREKLADLETRQAVGEEKHTALEDDFERATARIEKRIDSMSRAFWAATATFGALTLTGLGIIVTILSSQ